MLPKFFNICFLFPRSKLAIWQILACFQSFFIENELFYQDNNYSGFQVLLLNSFKNVLWKLCCLILATLFKFEFIFFCFKTLLLYAIPSTKGLRFLKAKSFHARNGIQQMSCKNRKNWICIWTKLLKLKTGVSEYIFKWN